MLKKQIIKQVKNNLTLNNSLELEENISIEAKGKGCKFTSKFIEAGVAHYEEFGDVLITKETLDKFINTIIGCPVIIKHKNIDDSNADKERVGVISEVWFNENDGWFYCGGIIWDKQAIDLVKNQGWSVSCTYDFESDFENKIHNGKKIDMEFINGEFLHLALVDNPRYERANIVMNAKDKEKGEWITVKGTHVFIEEGQDIQEALDKQFNKKEIEFTGKNTKDLKELLGDNLKVSDNGKITVNTEKGNITILKEDKVTIDGNNIEIKKPSYNGGKTIIAKLKDGKSFDYVDDGEKIQIIKDDNNKYHIHYGVDKEGKATSKASGFETLEEAEKTLKKHRPNYTEKQNSTDNTTKEQTMNVLNELTEFVTNIINNSGKEKEMSKEEKIKDLLKDKVDEETIQNVLNALEEKKEEKEEKFEEEKELAENKCKNEDDEKDKKLNDEKEEEKQEVKNSMEMVNRVINNSFEVENSLYLSQAKRIELGNNY